MLSLPFNHLSTPYSTDPATPKKDFLDLLRSGHCEDTMIEVTVPSKASDKSGTPFMFESGAINPGDFIKTIKGEKRQEKKRLKVSDARPILIEQQAGCSFNLMIVND